MELVHNVFNFIINFSVHAEIWSSEILPWHNPFLWHWWELSLILMKIFQALDYAIDFFGLSVDLMGPLFLGSSCINFVLLPICILNLLLLSGKMTLVLFLVWVVEVLLFQNIDDVISWNDTD